MLKHEKVQVFTHSNWECSGVLWCLEADISARRRLDYGKLNGERHLLISST